MPPRKEPKETVTYPASKRKAPPFKPQRPSQVPHGASTNSESTSRTVSRTQSANVSSTGRTNTNATKRTTSSFAPAGSGMFSSVGNAGGKRKGRVVEDDGEEDDIEDTGSKRAKGSDADGAEDSDDDLADDPLTAKPRKPPQPNPSARRKPGRPVKQKEPSPFAISDDDGDEVNLSSPGSPNGDVHPPIPSQSSEIPSIPRPLLLRLIHEHFASKDTKIDRHALAVLEKYFEIYLRETIARSLLAKKEDVEAGAASQSEERWLEKSDLEKIIAGVVMDF